MSGTESTGNASKERHQCKFSGCNKSFQRREHLARHARSHSETRYVCKVCQKEFTRSDSLQRHLALHGDQFKPGPSQRSKRACVTCHSSKIKCDGEQPCSCCYKKKIECKYDQPYEELQNASSKSGTTATASDASASRDASIIQAPSVTESTSVPTAISAEKDAKAQNSFAERLSAVLTRNKGPIDWSVARIATDMPTGGNLTYGSSRGSQPPSDDGDWPVLPESKGSKYRDLYFTHFHYRWPIVHAPTFEKESAHPVLLSCVTMIGACIHGTSGAKELATSLYTRVFDWILPRLGQLSSEDSIDHSSTFGLCQTSLLYIILAFYCGRKAILSKAIMVRSMLVAALREIGLFDPEKPVPYDKPGYFVPLKLVKEGLKQRLSTCLFKVDTYLSILRGQPTFLVPEELHFTLPSTFALWNGDGLSVFQTRHSIEPEARSRMTISRTILEPALDSITPTDGLMLVEDIQLGICAMHSTIWSMLRRFTDRPENEVSNAIERNFVKRRLESWKHWLLQNPIQETDRIDFSREQHLAMRHYYGLEDHSQPGWQVTVFNRPKNLILDTLMLYHILSIHLDADILVLTQLAKDKLSPDPVCPYREMNSQALKKREDSASSWAESASARRAMCRAADILVSYNSISGLENYQVDPIAYVALSVAGLVVWSYCTFCSKGCTNCVSEVDGLPFPSEPDTELTNWSGPRTTQVFEKDKETWIEMGICCGSLTGIMICRCNILLLVAKFRACIREGWDFADTIAPGVFKL